METTLIQVPPAAIRRSPLNHRRRFNGIEDLADSIAAKGLVQPITVRPVAPQAHDINTPTVLWELVVGERRWRAATIAAQRGQLETIPALVRELSDQEVIEIQLIENLKREDVHPIEEGVGYRELLDNYGYTIDQIATKTCRSRSTIDRRLRLARSLSPDVQQVFLDGRLPPTFADLVVTLSTPELQQLYVQDLLRGRREGAFSLSELGNDERDSPREGVTAEQDETLEYTHREAQLLLRRRYMLQLKLAPFPTDDATLIPAVGTCTTCALRTGNQIDLFGDVGPDVCTSLPCFAAKTKAAWERRTEEARTAGQRVLESAETDPLFVGGRIQYGAPWIDLADDADWQLQIEGGDTRTWRDVLDASLDVLPKVAIARDDLGAAHELVDRGAAMDALRAAGVLPKLPDIAPKPKADAKSKNKQQIREVVAREAIGAVAKEVADAPKWIETDWEWLSRAVARTASLETLERVCSRREISVGKTGPLKALLRAIDNIEHDAMRGLVVELLMWHDAANPQSADYGENLLEAVKEWRLTPPLDMKKLHAKVTKDFADVVKTSPTPARKRGAK